MVSTNTIQITINAKDHASGPLKGVSGMLGGFGGMLKQVAATAGGFLVANVIQNFGRQIMDLGREALEATASWERLGMAMESLVAREIRNTDVTLSMTDALAQAGPRAEELLGWIQQLAIKSPFDVEGVAIAFKTALAYGFTTEQAQSLTQATIDFAAATGATSSQMNMISLALGQMQAKGKLAGQEILQLTNAGVSSVDILESIGYTLDDVSKGLVSSDEFFEAFITTMTDDFGGAAERQSETWSGLLNTLGDVKKIGLREFFGGIFEAVQPLVSELATWLQGPGLEKLKQWGDAIGNLASGIIGVGLSIANSGISSPETFRALSAAFGEETAEKIQNIIGFFDALWDVLRSIINLTPGDFPWEDILPPELADKAYQISETFEAIRDAVIEFIAKAQEISSSIDWTAIAGFIKDIGDRIRETFNSPEVQAGIQTFIIVIGDIAAAIGDVLVGQTIPALMEAFENIKDALKSAGIDWGDLGKVVGVVVAVIAALILALLAVITGLINGIAKAVEAWSKHMANLQKIGRDTFDAIIRFIDDFILFMQSAVDGDWRKALELFGRLLGDAFDIVSGLLAGGVEMFRTQLDMIGGLVSGFVEGVVGFFENLYNRLVGHSLIPDMLEDVKTAFTDALESILEEVEQWVGDLITTISSKIQDFIDVGTDIVEGIKSGLRSAWGGLQGLFTELINMLPEWARVLLGIKSPSLVFRFIGESIVEGLIAGIKAKEKTLFGTIQAILETASQFGGIAGGFVPFFERDVLDPIQREIDAWQERIDATSDTLGDMFDTLAEQGLDMSGQLENALRRMDIGQLRNLMEMLRSLPPGWITGVDPELTQRAATNLEYIIGLIHERNMLEADYVAEQERILALQRQQQDLAFLQQQLELLDLIREHQLDPEAILGGMQLGLDAELSGILEAMTRAMQELIAEAEVQLGIASPSKVFERLGAFVMGGLARGIGQGTTLLGAAFRGAIPQMINQAAGSATTNNMNLVIHSNARTEDVLANFELMKALAGT